MPTAMTRPFQITQHSHNAPNILTSSYTATTAAPTSASGLHHYATPKGGEKSIARTATNAAKPPFGIAAVENLGTFATHTAIYGHPPGQRT